MMKKLAVVLVVLASMSSVASAAEGPLMLRLRGVYVMPADKSDAIGALSVPADKISVSAKVIPEVDISYFFLLPNLSAELILTYPQKHDVKVNVTGVGKIGTVTELPPCLTAQWHFLPGSMFNPYLGVGVNLTLITSQSLNVGGTLPLEVSKSSIGAVGQVGLDVQIIEQLYINADVKWVQMGFDVKTKADGAKVSHVTLNPWLFAVGVGYRL